MEIRNLHSSYELELLETSSYAARTHRNTFFEMVFVLEGTGLQMINDHQLPYAPDKLFLIFPQDKHGFDVRTFSRFFFIRFSNDYVSTQPSEHMRALEYIFHSHNHLPGCILKTITDKPFVRAAMEALIRESHTQSPHQQRVIQQLLNTILALAARNITLQSCPVEPQKGPDVLPILNYVHQHIFEPDGLRVEKIASVFHLSPTYVGEYFRKHTGESLQHYVMLYKLKLIETRLRYTDLRINEIADEFGFTDQSHLNRIFKKYQGKTPLEFRKEKRGVLT